MIKIKGNSLIIISNIKSNHSLSALWLFDICGGLSSSSDPEKEIFKSLFSNGS